jgi:DNA modification methylase
MLVIDQKITDKYAIYNGDSVDMLTALKDESIHFSVYSPPFATENGGALYHYSSSDRDLSNSRTYEEFFSHYEFIVREIHRATLPGRMTAVHCMDVPNSNSGNGDSYTDFPGDIIRLHERCGWRMASPRISIWKEPLAVRNRTMTKALAHKSIVEDSCNCAVAGADYLLIFRRSGKNEIPVTHRHGLINYAGTRKVPKELLKYKGWTGNQIENRYSQWIWRQYASSVWDDIRGNMGDRKEKGVLPYREAREEEDEKHLHPLQLDVITRAVELWSNPSETVLTPFMGVGSEVCASLMSGRRAIGCELKPSYYRQAVRNVDEVEKNGWHDDSGQEMLSFREEFYAPIGEDQDSEEPTEMNF